MAGPDNSVLILGGTGEARALAGLLAKERRLKVVTSLAGRTMAPQPPPGEWRSGGFGGADGLAAYLEREAIGIVADATHPFAAAMSRNAFEACRRTGTRYVRLERPAWRPEPGDRWQAVESVEQAAAALAPGARVFLTLGGGEIATFFARADTTLLARMIEPPEKAPPSHIEIFLDRPPFTLEGESALLRERGITVVVCKNSGGEATRAKLDAARELSLPVIMVARPEKPAAPSAATPEGLRDLVLELI